MKINNATETEIGTAIPPEWSQNYFLHLLGLPPDATTATDSGPLESELAEMAWRLTQTIGPCPPAREGANSFIYRAARMYAGKVEDRLACRIIAKALMNRGRLVEESEIQCAIASNRRSLNLPERKPGAASSNGLIEFYSSGICSSGEFTPSLPDELWEEELWEEYPWTRFPNGFSNHYLSIHERFLLRHGLSIRDFEESARATIEILIEYGFLYERESRLTLTRSPLEAFEASISPVFTMVERSVISSKLCEFLSYYPEFEDEILEHMVSDEIRWGRPGALPGLFGTTSCDSRLQAALPRQGTGRETIISELEKICSEGRPE